jgi:hypothetical protein
VFFYHPAVWWVSRRIRLEREHCCDDMAIAVTGDSVAYAEALVKVDTCRGVPKLALIDRGIELPSHVAEGYRKIGVRPPLPIDTIARVLEQSPTLPNEALPLIRWFLASKLQPFYRLNGINALDRVKTKEGSR